MPPVLGPLSPSRARLWSCAVARGTSVVPSVSARSEHSGPSRVSSTITVAPASPKRPEKHSRTPASAIIDVLGNNDPLASGQAVGLHHAGTVKPADVLLAGLLLGKGAPGSSGHAGASHDLLCELLGALHARCGGIWPKACDTRRSARHLQRPRQAAPPGQ